MSLARSILLVLVFACVACRARNESAPPREPNQQPPRIPPAVASAIATATALPPEGFRTEDEQNTIDVFERAAPSAVFVTQKQVALDWLSGRATEVPAGAGTGFVWDQEGHVVTNFHVVMGARSLTVTLQDQKSYPARVVGSEPRKDIAVLQIKAPRDTLRPIVLPKAGYRLEVGQKVIAIGNPFGLDHTLTTGVVSALGREMDGVGGVTIRDMVQTDAAINPGNSGGPLLDSAGRLIGMNTMIFSKTGASAGIGFAVPVESIRRVVPQLIQHGRVEQVGLGMKIDPQRRIERRFGIKGVVVLEIIPGSPAERAGLRGLSQTADGVSLGDVIVGIDDAKIESYDDLYNMLDGKKAGEKVRVKLQRENKIIEQPMELIVVQ
jgi:S1-C subfamily serine protease